MTNGNWDEPSTVPRPSGNYIDPVDEGPQEDPANARFFAAVGVPTVRTISNPDGSTTVYLDQDNDGTKDPSEPSATTPVAPGGGSLTQRTLLHEEDLGLAPQPLLPIGTGAVPVPDVQPQPGTPVPDHPGAGPVVTPGLGYPVGVLSTRNSGASNYCAYFTPEGGSETPITCVGRSFLGPLDPSMPRGDTTLVFYNPQDVPATGPIVTPDVPPTPGQPTPDVPARPAGYYGATPGLTMDVDVSYRYDSGRLTPLVGLLGEQTWSPAGPSDAAWLASPTNPAALTVTVTVYKDGVSQGTVGHSIPVLGQVLAAAEKTAGTLP